MKYFFRATLAVFVLCMIPFTGYSQDDYTMFFTIYLDPIPGHSVQLEEGVKAHNAKYHSEASNKAYLWSILSGPRAGQYNWGQGPTKYGEFDKALGKEHSEDWDKNVASHCKDVGNFQFWKRNDDITYNPANEMVGNNVLARIINIKESSQSRAAVLDAFTEIAKVLKAINSPQARRVYINEFGSPDSEDVVLIYPFSSFTAFEESKGLPPGFPQEFEKINGMGSFYRMVGSVLDEHSEDRYDEVRVMVQ